ncbi:histone H3.v1-like isoform X1 [Gadus morhua]|uniref:histone H3.v1-like isoform X1 n=1 Tax=Gadus morhua TaxID=8049 RepID=UPI0011B47932|nr:histone H3.v1-like isoform X1 [Gadus morhua]
MEEVEEEQEVEEVEEQEVEVFSETETGCEELRLGERETQSEEEEEREEEEDKDAEIFSAWMSRYRAGEAEKGRAEEHEGGGAPGRDPPVDPRGVARRRSSLPCTVTLSAMQFYRLHSAAEPPVSAKVLLQRTSSRGLLLSSPGPPLTSDPVTSPPNAQRRSSYIPPEDAPGHQPAHRTHFRRRSIMSMGDADSLCLICHKEFSQGDDGIQALPCSHTFHKQCVDEWLVSRPSCPTCQTSTPQTC